MMKKIFLSLLFLGVFITSSFAAGSIFPVSRMNMNGNVEYGYFDEQGNTVLPFSYYSASDFSDNGFAAVEDYNWKTAVINREGKIIVPYTDSPLSVEFGENEIAYRYEKHSVYYTLTGQKIGSFEGAKGFFSDNLLLCFDADKERYFYVNKSGSLPFSGSFLQAGAYANGAAVVKKEDNTYAVIGTNGQQIAEILGKNAPAIYTLYENDVLVVTNGSDYGLYSISKGEITGCTYTQISEFNNGMAIFRFGNFRGLIDLSGKEHQKASYNFLSYLGEGLYAARSGDGSCSVIDADGNLVYRTQNYVGGFVPLKHGLSWHGQLDGSIVFFNKVGGYFASIQNAERPTLLTENVVRVTKDNATVYINLATGKTIYTPPTTFALTNDIKIKSVSYEKFLGYQANGEEFGWKVNFPELYGMADTTLQKSINAAVRDFFLKGPSVTAEYDALEGGFGASVHGSVLVVHANCISGKGNGASVWNNSLAFDLNTGKQYKMSDLFVQGYEQVIRSMLPNDHAFYEYTFPRMSADGVCYYYNEYESNTRRAYTVEYQLKFDELDEILNKNGDCYKALKTAYQKPVSSFTDVQAGYWAFRYIKQVSEEKLMVGYDNKFRPTDSITSAEVCATIARKLKLDPPKEIMPGINSSKWYAKEVSAVYENGLLEGLENSFYPDNAMRREDAIQIFANVLQKQGKTLHADAKKVVSKYADAAEITANRVNAVALCTEQGIIEGSGGKLYPRNGFTRAEFAKLLTLI